MNWDFGVSALLDVRRLLLSAATAGVLGAALGGWAGHALTRNHYTSQIATQQAEAERVKREAVQAALDQVKAARAAGDAAQAGLAAALATNAQLTQERDDAIAKVTTGRACLRGPALRVLNGAPGLRVSGLVPSTAAGAAAADAAAGGYPGGATEQVDDGGPVVTDTGIARWALRAGNQYEQCRQRLDALIDYSLATTAPPAVTRHDPP